MKTVDGIKDSANRIINAVNKGKHKLNAKEEKDLRYLLLKKTLMKYKILIIRNKISFSAFEK